MRTRPSIIAVLRSCVLAMGIATWLAIPSFALTAQEIITRARVILNDASADTTRQRFSDAQLLAFLNDGQREAGNFSQVLQSTFGITLVGGTTEYALPSDFITPWNVTYFGKKLDQTTFNKLDADSIGWRTSRGTPTSYYVYLADTMRIGFVPAPVVQSTGPVVVYYTQQPNDLTSLSQSPWNSWIILTPYHSALIYYIAYRGYLTMLDSTTAGAYFNEWTMYVAAMRDAASKMPDYNPGMSGKR